MLGRETAAVTDLPLALRRLTFALLGLSLTALLLWLAVRVLAPGGWTLWEVLLLACFAGTAPWTALCAANALVGGVVLLAAPNPPAAVLPALRRARPGAPPLRTAIAVCIRAEDMGAVLPPLARLLDGLEAAGAADRFTLWFLSDTADPQAAAAEERAISAFRQGGIAVRYRRRAENTGFKAGNVMDFLDHHAGDAELMLCLDADSEMTAPAVLRLVACMEADPGMAILQQLIVGRPATAAFPRLFQFGMRRGDAQLGHRPGLVAGAGGAVLGPQRHHPHRALPPPLPAGGIAGRQPHPVARPGGGGAAACRGLEGLLPAEEEGSMEGNPPALPEFMARDLRWAAGNMQYWDLLWLPGQTWMGRWQLVQAILLFVGAPLWCGVLAFAALNAATGGGAATPAGWLLALMLATWAMLHAPKLVRLCRGAAEAPAGRALWRARRLPARGGGGARLHHAARPHQHLQQGTVPAGAALRWAGTWLGGAEPGGSRRGLGGCGAAALAAYGVRGGGVRAAGGGGAGRGVVGAARGGRAAAGDPLLRPHRLPAPVRPAARPWPGGDARGTGGKAGQSLD